MLKVIKACLLLGLDVLNCTWEDDKLFCLTAPGYEFTNIATDYLVITIPRATPDHNGTYGCHLKGVQIESCELCHLTVITGNNHYYQPPKIKRVVLFYFFFCS